MRHKHLRFGRGCRVVLGDEPSQAAQMTLGPGETEGGPGHRHPRHQEACSAKCLSSSAPPRLWASVTTSMLSSA